MKVYCWANGEIGFGSRAPRGSLIIAEGPAKPLRKMIEATARLAYDNVTLLVPGVPEAVNEEAAADALGVYMDLLRKRRHAGIGVNRILPAGVQS